MAQLAVVQFPQLPHSESTHSTIKDAAWQIQAQMGVGFVPAFTTTQETE